MAKVLLVDDDISVLEMLSCVLEKDEHEVVNADKGSAALKAFYTGDFDLVITDLIMPEMDGMQLIEEMKRFAPTIKILAISGGDLNFSGSSYLRAAKNLLGANHILEKPFNYDELAEAITKILND